MKTGFTGGIREFVQHLRSEDKFYFKSEVFRRCIATSISQSLMSCYLCSNMFVGCMCRSAKSCLVCLASLNVFPYNCRFLHFCLLHGSVS